MASKLLNLVALSSLAVLAASFGATPVNALSSPHGHLNRHVDHVPLARKKRDSNKRCKTRSVTPSSTQAPPTSTAKAQPLAATTTTTPASSKAPPKTTSAKSSSTTSSASAASGSGEFGTKGHKICHAWAMGNDPSVLQQFTTSHTKALYDWSVEKPEGADALGYDYWPMLWGGAQDKIDAFNTAMKQPGLGTMVLGFNEPNEQGQSNMDPTWAASLWKQYIQPHCNAGYKCCTPAMSSRPNGFQWMQTFMDACGSECTFDYQCVHWYDIGIDSLTTYLTKYHNQVGLPIILTEFADQNFNGGAQASMSDIWSFMSSALSFVDNTDWMAGACPFGILNNLQGVNQDNALLGSNNSPTDLGYFVINNGN